MKDKKRRVFQLQVPLTHFAHIFRTQSWQDHPSKHGSFYAAIAIALFGMPIKIKEAVKRA